MAVVDHAVDSRGLSTASSETAAWLSLVPYVRHTFTDYDELLAEGYDPDSADILWPRGWIKPAGSGRASSPDSLGLTRRTDAAGSARMIETCLISRTHYLDITGEIDVFVAAQRRHAQAQAAGIVICPGVGFDVIPTDCIAAVLKEALFDATHLVLAFDAEGPMSSGTARTLVDSFQLATAAAGYGGMA